MIYINFMGPGLIWSDLVVVVVVVVVVEEGEVVVLVVVDVGVV